ncbi:hypothetical protein NPIL_448891 [Nephila pilipes]|uniref:Uncharacterized protein n=1 Tax=Nephila pilipes TaxID=299642 RepID=A0A8X6TGD9_NEPPI|nr:hypothetical protein NPIL_448891 [Nephila pilipes]
MINQHLSRHSSHPRPASVRTFGSTYLICLLDADLCYKLGYPSILLNGYKFITLPTAAQQPQTPMVRICVLWNYFQHICFDIAKTVRWKEQRRFEKCLLLR